MLKKIMAFWLLNCLLISLAPAKVYGFSTEKNLEDQKDFFVLLVEESIWKDKDLKQAIKRYSLDAAVSAQAEPRLVPIKITDSPLEIYEGLADAFFTQRDLKGVVIIGQVPIPIVQKADRFWPSVFPYTDFVNPLYTWNHEVQKFQAKSIKKASPEIWHGIIQSRETDFEPQKAELLKYFAKNHLYHKGELTYEPSVFIGDFTRQKKQITEKSLKRYTLWNNYSDEWLNQRFSRKLITRLKEGLEDEPSNKPFSNDDGPNMPDVFSKQMASTLMQPYTDIYENWLSQWYEMAGRTGRWKPENIDTTVKLVEKKDLASYQYLDQVNRTLEDKLIADASRLAPAAKLTFPTHETVRATDVPKDINPKDVSYFNKEEGDKLIRMARIPLFLKGTKHEDLNAYSCSGFEGTVTSASEPLSQMVEYKKPITLETVAKCADLNTDGIDDVTGFCCSAPYLKKQGLTKPNTCENNNLTYRQPVKFSQAAETGIGPIASEGCFGIAALNSGEGQKTISTFTVHQSPGKRVFQMGSASTSLPLALPVDQKKKIAYTVTSNNGYQLKTINLPNVLNHLQGKWNADTLNEKIKKDLRSFYGQMVTTNNKESLEKALSEAENLLDKSFNKYFVLDALTWVGLEINEKNKEAFKLALEKSSDPNKEFCDFCVNSYEYAHVVTQADSKEGLVMHFEPSQSQHDKELAAVKSDIALFTYEQDFFDTTQTFAEEKTNKELQKTLKETAKEQTECKIKSGGDNAKYETCLDDVAKKGAANVINYGPDIGLTNKETLPTVQPIQANQNLPKDIKLKASVNTLVFNTHHYETQTIEVEVVDKNGQRVLNDFQTEVSLDFGTQNVDRFFSVSPEGPARINAGRTTFTVYAKGSGLVDTFKGELKTKNQSTPLEVRFVARKLAHQFSNALIQAGSKTPVTLDIWVQKSDQLLDTSYQQKGIQINKIPGEIRGFKNLVNGSLKLQYLPPEKAGIYYLDIKDPAAKIPDYRIPVEIFPAQTNKLSIKAPRTLLKETPWQEITIAFKDAFENTTRRQQMVTVETTNLDIFDKENLDTEPNTPGFQLMLEGEMNLKVQPQNRGSASIELRSEGFSAQHDFEVLDKAQLKVQLSKKSVIAGEETSVRVRVNAIAGTKLLDGEQSIQLVQVPEPFMTPSKPLKLKDGALNFTFDPGTKAGKYTLEFHDLAFETIKIPFEVKPVKAAKVELSLANPSKEFLNAETPIELNVSVRDRFGNLAASATPKTVKIRPTELTKSKVLKPQTAVDVKSGMAQVFLKPSGEAGNIHLIAEAPGLVSDTVEAEITNFMPLTEKKHVINQSLHTTLLGYEAGNLFNQHNAINWLHEGRSQSIGTLVNTKKQKKSWGYLGVDGYKTKALKAELKDKPFLEFVFRKDKKVVAEIRTILKSNLSKSINGNADLNIITNNGSDFIWDNERLRFQSTPILKVREKGGLSKLHPDLRLEARPNSFLIWDLFINKQYLGLLHINQTLAPFEVVNFFDVSDTSTTVKIRHQNIYAEKAFTGASTNTKPGLIFKDKKRLEKVSATLGLNHLSAEDALDFKYTGWTTEWNPAHHFASNNTIGESSLPGQSDAWILYGDPTVRIQNKNPKNALGITKDLGTIMHEDPNYDYKFIKTLDINKDGFKDLLTSNGRTLRVFWNREGKLTKTPSTLYEFKDLVTTLEAFQESLLVLYKEKGPQALSFDGKVLVKGLVINGITKIENLKTVRSKAKDKQELIVANENRNLFWVEYTNKRFQKPVQIGSFAPEFTKIKESNKAPGNFLSSINLKQKNGSEVITKATKSINLELNGKKYEVGQTFWLTLEFKPLKSDNATLILKNFNHFKVAASKIKCQGCEQKPRLSFSDRSSKHLSLGNLKSIIQLEIPLVLVKQNKLHFQVGDYNADGLSDISLPFKDQNKETVVQFLTTNKNQIKSSPFTKRVKNITNKEANFIRSVNENDLVYKLQNAEGDEANLEIVFTLDSDKDSLPDIYDPFPNGEDAVTKNKTSAAENLCEKIIQMTKPADNDEKSCAQNKACGNDKDSVPSDNAPGLVPNDNNIGAKENNRGKPDFAYPTTDPLGNPSFAPKDIPGDQDESVPYQSSFRYYNIKTSQGRPVMAFCTGSFRNHMAFPNWSPNCNTVTPPNPSSDFFCKPQPSTDQILQAGLNIISPQGEPVRNYQAISQAWANSGAAGTSGGGVNSAATPSPGNATAQGKNLKKAPADTSMCSDLMDTGEEPPELISQPAKGEFDKHSQWLYCQQQEIAKMQSNNQQTYMPHGNTLTDHAQNNSAKGASDGENSSWSKASPIEPVSAVKNTKPLVSRSKPSRLSGSKSRSPGSNNTSSPSPLAINEGRGNVDARNNRNIGDSLKQLAHESPFINVRFKPLTVTVPYQPSLNPIGGAGAMALSPEYENFKQSLFASSVESPTTLSSASATLGAQSVQNQQSQNLQQSMADTFDMGQKIASAHEQTVKNLYDYKQNELRTLSALAEVHKQQVDYVNDNLEANEQQLDKWENQTQAQAATVEGWNMASQIVKDFTATASTCEVDQGDLEGFNMNEVLMKDVPYKVTPVQRPNAETKSADQMNLGVDVEMPQVSLNLVPLAAGKNGLSGTGNIPQVPATDIPRPQISSVQLSLPLLPEPPALKDMLPILAQFTGIPQGIFDLLADIKKGVATVPEWFTRPMAISMTNRMIASHGEGDFSEEKTTTAPTQDAQVRSENKTSQTAGKQTNSLPPIPKTSPEVYQGVRRPDTMSQYELPEEAKELRNWMTDYNHKIESAAWRTDFAAMIKDGAAYAQTKVGNNGTQKELQRYLAAQSTAPKVNLQPLKNQLALYDTQVQESLNQQIANVELEIQILAQTIKNESSPLAVLKSPQVLAMFDNQENKYFASNTNHQKEALFKHLAANNLIDQVQTSLTKNKTTEITTKKPLEEVLETKLYLIDAASGFLETITTHPLKPEDQMILVDLNNDNQEEIIYTHQHRLYLKTMFEPHAKEADYSLNIVDPEDFMAPFIATNQVHLIKQPHAVSVGFNRFYGGIPYFEFMHQNRYDRFIDPNFKTENINTELLNRNGAVIRPPLQKYDIRPFSASITSIKGNPKIIGNTFVKMPTFKTNECQGESRKAPYFKNRITLIAEKNNTRLEVHVPPRKNQEADFREIILNKGEETEVESAYICPTRGSIGYFEKEDQTEIDLRKGMFMPPNTKMFLEANDEVILDIFDGTNITVSGNTVYQFNVYSSEKDFLRIIDERTQTRNHFGTIYGYYKNQRSIPSVIEFINQKQP